MHVRSNKIENLAEEKGNLHIKINPIESRWGVTFYTAALRFACPAHSTHQRPTIRAKGLT